MEEKQTMEEKKKPTMSGKTLKLLLAIWSVQKLQVENQNLRLSANQHSKESLM